MFFVPAASSVHCECASLYPFLYMCALFAVLLFATLGYTEPFLRGCLGFPRVALLARLRSAFESADFAPQRGVLTGQNGGVLLEALSTRWAELNLPEAEDGMQTVAAEDDEPAIEGNIAGLVVIPGRLHLRSRYYYQNAGFPHVWKY